MRSYVLPIVLIACQAHAYGIENGIGSNPIIVPEEIVVSAPEPRYVAPTLRDRIGRIWAPVTINGKGPFRLVLDTGANRSVVTQATAQKLGADLTNAKTVQLHGVTG